MVRTRKKDYGEPLLPKRKPSANPPNAIMILDAPTETRTTDVNQDTVTEELEISEQSSGPEFTLFRNLPCELRLMIWKAYLSPQLVTVKLMPNGQRELQHKRMIRGIPALLAVNRESRHIALGHYSFRFTINITFRDCSLRRDRIMADTQRQHARVIMSPDDTLGLFCWDVPDYFLAEYVKKSQDKSAHQSSPWTCHQASDGPQSRRYVKKFAILGYHLGSNLRIVEDLDSAGSWYLDPFPHPKTREFEYIYPVCGPWYSSSKDSHSKHLISIKSDSFTRGLRGWSELQPEDIHKCLELLHPEGRELDIWAFDLRKKGIYEPQKIIDIDITSFREMGPRM